MRMEVALCTMIVESTQDDVMAHVAHSTVPRRELAELDGGHRVARVSDHPWAAPMPDGEVQVNSMGSIYALQPLSKVPGPARSKQIAQIKTVLVH